VTTFESQLVVRGQAVTGGSTDVLIGSLFLGLILAVPVVATIGVWFHFDIGGTL
jgi:hypothetical protein